MNRLFLSRGGLLASVTGVHLAALWALLAVFNNQPVEPPIAYPMVMAEMLPAPPQPRPQPVQQPAPPVKREPLKQPKPAPRPTVKPAPAPLPTPNTTPSEHAISAPPAPPQPAPAPSAPAEPAPAAPAPVSAPRFDAAYLNNPPPAYPSLSRRLGEEGRVLLRVHVTPEGGADDVRVHASSGSSLLDEAAAAAVRKWRFVPARQGGNPVAAWVQVPIAFKLN